MAVSLFKSESSVIKPDDVVAPGPLPGIGPELTTVICG